MSEGDVGDEDGHDKVLDRLIGKASELSEGVPRKAIRDLLGEGLAAKLPPAGMYELKKAIAKNAKMTILQLDVTLTDERNRIAPNKVLSTTNDVAEAWIEDTKKLWSDMAWCGGELWLYNSDETCGEDEALHFWKGHTADEVSDNIAETYQGFPVVSRSADVKATVSAIARTLRHERFFADERPGLNLAGRFLTWDTERKKLCLLKPSPDHRARFRLPFAYDKDAKAPVFLAGLNRVLPEDDRRDAVQEFIGAMLLRLDLPGDNARHALMLKGQANSGKSTIIKVVAMLLPENRVSHVEPSSWGRVNSRIRLEHALANTVTELGKETIKGDEVKKIISWEPVSGRRLYCDETDFVSRAWHLFGANELPKVDDASGAISRRFLAIAFDHPLAREEQDPEFFAKVAEELPGIVTWAAIGARRVALRGHFQVPDCHEGLILQMQFANNIRERFLQQCLETTNEPGDMAKYVFDCFAAFSRDNEAGATTWQQSSTDKYFTSRIRSLFGCGTSATTGHLTRRDGIRVKNQYRV